MNNNSDIIINQFLRKEFPIKRIRDMRKKWVRVIIIPQGFIRQDKKTYPIERGLPNRNKISSDITETISYVFGFNQKIVAPLVNEYLSSIKL